jgi:hypothetical protein
MYRGGIASPRPRYDYQPSYSVTAREYDRDSSSGPSAPSRRTTDAQNFHSQPFFIVKAVYTTISLFAVFGWAVHMKGGSLGEFQFTGKVLALSGSLLVWPML